MIVGAAAIVRLAAADHSLWFDEQASAFFSDQPLARLWSDWILRETNPPLYYSLLRAWRAVFGSTDFAIRALSVCASLVAIVMAFVVARRAYGERAGLITATLAALSAQQLYFAEQARSYTFVLCAVLVAVDALLIFCAAGREHRATRWRAMTAYAVAATAAAYLHSTMILFPGIVLIAVIVADPDRYKTSPSLLLPLIVASVAILLGSFWVIRITVLQTLHHGDNIAAIGLADVRLIVVYALQTIFLSGQAGGFGYGIAVLVLALVTGFVVWNRHDAQTRLLAALGVVALATLGTIGMIVPVFVPRTIFWITAVTQILAGGALARISAPRWRWSACATLIALLAFNAFQVARTLEQEDWNTPVRRLAQRPDAVLLVQGEAMAVLADATCRRRLRRDACPYAVIAVTDPKDRYDTWARGTFTGAQVPVNALPDHVAGRTVFLFRKADFHDLPATLHRHGLGHGVPADGPPLLGPYPGAALR